MNDIYRVYVIEACDGLYVGQSAKHPRERLREHQRGKRYCRTCKDRHYLRQGPMRLRPDLAKGFPAVTSRKVAEAQERALARKLRSLGYKVRGGH